MRCSLHCNTGRELRNVYTCCSFSWRSEQSQNLPSGVERADCEDRCAPLWWSHWADGPNPAAMFKQEVECPLWIFSSSFPLIHFMRIFTFRLLSPVVFWLQGACHVWVQSVNRCVSVWNKERGHQCSTRVCAYLENKSVRETSKRGKMAAGF